jgi:hypothetical protein
MNKEGLCSEHWKHFSDPLQWFVVCEIKEEALLAVTWVLRQLCPTWLDVFRAVLGSCLRELPLDAWEKIK